ncbi:hypothetical protein PIB30_005012 [Stylosanthes scabra]|uniref:Uncharacterized protein n=1 Tax=Stylosanthes scabra TaxID=79078 RepID=A0ABU6Y1Y5_9FABA|nr:hypothetical protein [Stylosanthes scabra]
MLFGLWQVQAKDVFIQSRLHKMRKVWAYKEILSKWSKFGKRLRVIGVSKLPTCGDPCGERPKWGRKGGEFSQWDGDGGQNPPEVVVGTRAGNPRPRIPEKQ